MAELFFVCLCMFEPDRMDTSNGLQEKGADLMRTSSGRPLKRSPKCLTFRSDPSECEHLPLKGTTTRATLDVAYYRVSQTALGDSSSRQPTGARRRRDSSTVTLVKNPAATRTHTQLARVMLVRWDHESIARSCCGCCCSFSCSLFNKFPQAASQQTGESGIVYRFRSSLFLVV